jgi:UDP-GlcNAc3NAcA epimerase
MKRKIVTIVGARPQFIKAAPVSRILRQQYVEVLVNTGQHYDHNMAGVFFKELNIPKPDYDLGVGSGSHGKQTGDALTCIEEVLLNEKPSGVIVYGDTNSTLAGALAASKLHIPLFHIEAGLRSFNKKMPEEVNRKLTDHISDMLFSPSQIAVQNLRYEGITEHVYNVGDVMYDAILYNMQLAEQRYTLNDLSMGSREYILTTIHRAENTDNKGRLESIVKALTSIRMQVVFPVHPRTKKQLKIFGLYDELSQKKNIRLIEPVSYLEMLLLEKNATAIVTDSGGVQKEAYFFRVPCFTLRRETEWTETVKIGWNTLMDPQSQRLDEIICAFQPPAYIEGLYGTGRTAEQIVKHIPRYFE